MKTDKNATSLRVLVVDDEAPIRRLIDRTLQRAGYLTATAGSGIEALAVGERFGPVDLLVTDMNMPEMNGAELARRLRFDHPDLKVLYFTGCCDQLFDTKGIMWEDEAFLEKPCTALGLLEALSLLQTHNEHIGVTPDDGEAGLVMGGPR